MNYYPHHIGDFDKATRHLTRIERSIYRDLIDVYFTTEKPLTLDRAVLCRKVIAISNDEATAVEQVLNEFFTETIDGWTHDGCEAEISKYRKRGQAASSAGKASAARRAALSQQGKPKIPTTVEKPLNVRPTNQNQEPEPEPEEKLFCTAWDAYPKRAGGNPKTAALKAWKARKAAGEDEQQMLDGVVRYAAYCVATDKIGTEFVKMAASFLGPDGHYLQEWTAPPPRPGNSRIKHDGFGNQDYRAGVGDDGSF